MALEDYGLTPGQRDKFETAFPDGDLARVLAANRTNLLLQAKDGPVLGELAGRLRYVASSDSELPGVGDWVSIQLLDELAIVLHVHERRTVIRRRDPGRPTDYQLIAANVDTAFIVQPANQPVHLRRLERYVVAARDGGAKPVILLSKSDLISEEELESAVAEGETLAPTIPVSSVEEGGADALAAMLRPGSTFVLLGPSGVGKSTLLNRLVGEEMFATADVRAGDQKGRHTTTRRELVLLPGGAMVIDTPGMREFGMTDVKGGLDQTFDQIAALGQKCRYRDCTHTVESGCAVIQAVADGELEQSRLDSFLRLEREAAHFERTHLESRRKDKAFGKLIKSTMKAKKDRR